jgi:hypothetical protein
MSKKFKDEDAMTKQFHGITSLGLVGVGTVIAAAAMFKASWVLGVVYLGICLMASLTIPRVYCAKYPCKARCQIEVVGENIRWR